MKNLLLTLIIIFVAACATAKTAATGIIVASDIAADTLADTWEDAVTDRIIECKAKDLATKDERAMCLGKFHPDETEKVIAAVEALVAVQMLVKAAAECEALVTCATETDWADLAKQATAAWDALKPYAQLVKDRDEP